MHCWRSWKLMNLKRTHLTLKSWRPKSSMQKRLKLPLRRNQYHRWVKIRWVERYRAPHCHQYWRHPQAGQRFPGCHFPPGLVALNHWADRFLAPEHFVEPRLESWMTNCWTTIGTVVGTVVETVAGTNWGCWVQEGCSRRWMASWVMALMAKRSFVVPLCSPLRQSQ